MKKKLLSLLVLLVAAVTGAWAQWTGGTYTATANENLNAINVSDDATLTINQGVTVTVNGGITVASGKTLTVTGGGTLVANGANGGNGDTNQPGNAGGTAIAGNVIINGVGLTVTATGGQGGQGGQGYAGDNGYGDYSGGQGDQGSTGGNGGYAFSDAVTIYAGSVTAYGGTGGKGGQGGKGGKGGPGDTFDTGAYGGNGGWGGQGGYGGYAFAGTLTVFGGNVTAYGGAGGAGGAGGDGGDGGQGDGDPGESGEPGDVGDDGGQSNAYANNVTFQATTYTMTDGTNPITDATGKNNVIIQSPDVEPAPAGDYLFTVAPCEHGSGKVTFTVQDKDDAEKITENAKGANEGDKVTMTITPDAGWIVDDTKVKAESYSTWEAAGAPSRRAPGNITILGDVTLTKSTTAENTWTFTMPAASVLVSAGYIKSSTLYFDPADKTNLVKVTVDGTDRNLNGSKTVKIKRVDNVLEGTAVTLTANQGYKFRKVQVTKTDNGLKLTNPTVGQVIGSDGKNYAYASLPTGVTAVAKICYVSGNSGLALALADESTTMDWATAIETCAAHTPAFKGAEWKLASQDEWNNMKSGAGSYANLRNGFSSVGGTDMRSLQEETYWSSTEQVNSQNAWYMLNSGNWYRHDKSVTKYVRACLAF